MKTHFWTLHSKSVHIYLGYIQTMPWSLGKVLPPLKSAWGDRKEGRYGARDSIRGGSGVCYVKGKNLIRKKKKIYENYKNVQSWYESSSNSNIDNHCLRLFQREIEPWTQLPPVQISGILSHIEDMKASIFQPHWGKAAFWGLVKS